MRTGGLLLLALMGPALCACDPQGAPGKGDKQSSSFDTSDPKNIPAPAHFGTNAPDARQTEAARELATAAAAPAPAPAPASQPTLESHERTAYLQQVSFDGASRATGQMPAVIAAMTAPPARKPGTKRNSPVADAVTPTAVVLTDRQMAIDTDGLIVDPSRRRQVISRDRWHRNDTALTIRGRALDSTRVPYVSVPKGFPYARTGDLVQVSYNGRSTWAVVGDVGPRGRFGEGSVALAERLGIPSDGTSGGVWSGVTYSFPGRRAADLSSQDGLVASLETPPPPFIMARL